MSKFLSRDELYRILQRELPEDLYADGAPNQYLTTAENDSVAQVIASSYSTMEQVSLNNNILTTDVKIVDWEIMLFGETSTESLTLDERRDRVIAKLLTRNELSYWQVMLTCDAIIGRYGYVEVRQRNTKDNSYSILIKGTNSDLVWGPLWTAGDPAPAGVTVTDDLRNNQSDLYAVREEVYTYDVVVFSNYVNINILASKLDSLLTYLEPARSAHTVTVIPTDEGFNPDIEATRYNSGNGALFRHDANLESGMRRWFWYFGFEDDPTALSFSDYYDPGTNVVWVPPVFCFEDDLDGPGFGDYDNTPAGGFWASILQLGGGWYFSIV